MSVVVNDTLTGIPSSGGGSGDSWSDPLDSSIVPDTDNTYNVGSSSSRFSIVYGRNYISKGTTATASGLFSFDNSSGSSLMRIQAGNSTPSGVSASAAIFDGSSLSGDLAVHSNSNSTADANPTKSVAIETGNKTAGTGDSGQVKITTGTSSGGVRGNIELSAARVRLENNIAYTGAFGSNQRSIAYVDGAGRIQMGQSGVDFRINGPVTPAADGTLNNGTTLLRWLNVSSDQFEGAGGITFAAQTTPSGIGSVAGIQSSSVIDTGMWTGNNANADTVKTQDVFIETGNKTAGTGDSGFINIQTGTSAGGARGNVNLNCNDVVINAVNVDHNRAVNVDFVIASGVTGSRPGAPVTGQNFFDTTLGIPIWFDGTTWIDAAGTSV